MRRNFHSAVHVHVAAFLLSGVFGCSSAPAQHSIQAETAAPPVDAPAPDVSAALPQDAQLPDAPDLVDAAPSITIQAPALTVQAPHTVGNELVFEQIDLTAAPDDLWDRLRRGFSMPDLDSPLVDDREVYYAEKAADLRRMLERGKLYLHHIVDELDKRGMPTELALLPMVESAFNPTAYSSAKAAGLWQFIPSTGRQYKLQQNPWYDGRLDIVASTDAALDYLQFLYEMHGDWQLALASYNWGENAVARAIEKNRARGLATDYASLQVPKETRYYVPKLQALKNIISAPRTFGINLDSIADKPYFATVPVRNIDLKVAAELAGMPVQELAALNPGHMRSVILTSNARTLVLPVNRIRVFKANLAKRTMPLASWKTYRLERGDTLSRLASQHGISVSKLKKINGITRRTPVSPGMELLLPVKDHPGSGRAGKPEL